MGRDDRWCGACGALAGERDDATGRAGGDRPVVERATRGGGGTPRRGPRVVGAAVLVAVLAAALVHAAGSGGSGGSTVGRIDVATGASSPSAPPVGLRPAWTTTVPVRTPREDGSMRLVGAAGRLLGDAARVVLDDVVVDVATGEVVGRPPWGAGVHHGVLVAEDVVVEVDPLSGAVGAPQRVTGLPDGWALAPGARARAGDVVVAERLRAGGATVPGWAFIGLDGAVVATLEGDGYGSPTGDGRGGDLLLFEQFGGPVDAGHSAVVVDGRTGRVVHVLSDEHGSEVWDASLVPGHAVVVRLDDSTQRPGEQLAWDIDVLAVPEGRAGSSVSLPSDDRPVPLGLLADGSLAVATAHDELVQVHAVEDHGRARRVTYVEARVPAGGSIRTGSGLVGVTADGLVVHAAHDHLEAIDGAGRTQWSTEVGRVTGVALGPSVAVATVLGGGGAVQVVVDLADGRPLARFERPSAATPMVRVGVALDGAVGLATTGESWLGQSSPVPPLLHGAVSPAAIAWHGVRDGEQRDAEDVLRPHLDTAPSEVFRFGNERLELLGTAADDAGRAWPVLLRQRPAGPLEMLGPDGRLLPLTGGPAPNGAGDDAVFSRLAYLVGVAGSTAVSVELDPASGAPTTRGLDLADGSRRWTSPFEAAHLVGDLVLGGSGDGQGVPPLTAVDAATGEERWRAADVPLWTTSVGPGDDELLVVWGPIGLRALDTADGSVAWEQPLPVAHLGAAVLTDQHVVVPGAFGEVVAVDRRDGAVAWQVDAGAAPTGAITGAGDHVLVGTMGGEVVHLDGDGNVAQRWAAVDGPVEQVVVVDGTVLAVAGERVAAFRVDGRGLDPTNTVELP